MSDIGMKTRVRELTAEIQDAERNLNRLKRDMNAIQSSCQHEWSKAVYTPIIREGYQDPGDPVGTMGVDWRGPLWVPRDEKPRWTRECHKCLLTETTSQTTEKVEKIPQFSSR
jgi:hypothetical protein